MSAVQDATIADLQRQLDDCRKERDAALAREAALAEILEVINRSPDDPQPVFEAILEKARLLCGAEMGVLQDWDGEYVRILARSGYSEDLQALMPPLRQRTRPGLGQLPVFLGERFVHVLDATKVEIRTDEDDGTRNFIERSGTRTWLSVPLRRNDALIGAIAVARSVVRAFTVTEIVMLERLAAPAVIAIENARLLTELQQRTEELARRNSEYGERIEQQSATIDVLEAMSASAGDAQPVLELIAQRAATFCQAGASALALVRDGMLHLAAYNSHPDPTAYEASFPRPIDATSAFGRTVLAREIVQIADSLNDPEYGLQHLIPDKSYSIIGVPLSRGGQSIGAIILGRPRGDAYTDTQVEFLRAFAEQAVIAISSAETYHALQTRTADLQESLEYQNAISDVLKVISRSTFDLQPVLDTLVETAARLCDADQAIINRREGIGLRLAANFGFPPEYEAYFRSHGLVSIDAHTTSARAASERRPVHIHDVTTVPGYPEAPILLGKQRTSLGVPLLRESEVIGTIVLARRRVEPFTDRQIQLISTFADQAVIAIENTRLLTEQREALEQQTATTEVLQVINASPGDLAPVFDAILEKAHTLCGAVMGSLVLFDGTHFRAAATLGYPEGYDAVVRQAQLPTIRTQALIGGERFVHVLDLKTGESELDHAVARSRVAMTARTALWMPLRKDNNFLGFISAYRSRVQAFSDQEITLLENFAAQAVIAMDNARLLDEIRQRQEELRITFENMADGVAMFDETQTLVAWNGKFQEIFNLPDALLEQHLTYEAYLRFLAERGEFGANVDTAEQIHELVASTGQPYGYERSRPDGRVIEIRRNPVPDGGFVLIFSDITERKRSEAEIHAARDAAENALRELRATQASLIQAEKMASLGQLTAGVAHEIKNPLNFINNFASLSVDLLDELKQTAAPGFSLLDDARRAEIDELASTLASNLDKINEHGRRADGIVRSMLEHSRGSSGDRRSVDLNTLVKEALNLAYHGARARDQSFTVKLERDLDRGITSVELVPQDITRVLLNLFNNGFYAAHARRQTAANSGFEPTLKVITRQLDSAVEIRVRDNGIGIPAEIRDKLFQPFFTTKPTGEGTGLGLSISYDIVTQQHGGSITVDSKFGEYSEFAMRLPHAT